MWQTSCLPPRPNPGRFTLRLKRRGERLASRAVSVVGHRCRDARISADERSDVGARGGRQNLAALGLVNRGGAAGRFTTLSTYSPTTLGARRSHVW